MYKRQIYAMFPQQVEDFYKKPEPKEEAPVQVNTAPAAAPAAAPSMTVDVYKRQPVRHVPALPRMGERPVCRKGGLNVKENCSMKDGAALAAPSFLCFSASRDVYKRQTECRNSKSPNAKKPPGGG